MTALTIITAEQTTAELGLTQTPNKVNTLVGRWKSRVNRSYIRYFYSKDPKSNKEGSWMTEKSDYGGKSAEQIKDELALKDLLDSYVEVEVPQDTDVEVCIAGKNDWVKTDVSSH